MNEIIELCNKIKENAKCMSCASEKYDNCVCVYCGNENKILKENIDRLRVLLNNKNDFTEEELMVLYSINSLHIDFVVEKLRLCNFFHTLDSKYIEINNNLENNILSNDNYKYMLLFIEYGNLDNVERTKFINYLMKEMILDKISLSNDFKLSLIKNFTEMVMAGKVRNPKCVFEKLNDYVVGKAAFDRVYLDANDLNELLNNKKYIELLEVIFHECTHTYQDYIMMCDKPIAYRVLTQTKERFIRMSIDGYYDENYVNYNSEVEARSVSANLTLQYLKLLNLDLSNCEYLKNVINREGQLFYNQNRTLNGVETTVDDLFLSLNRVDLLKMYPVLNVQFKEQDGVIVKKDINELIYDFECYKNGSLKLNGSSNDIEFLYNYLIGSMNKNKERS